MKKKYTAPWGRMLAIMSAISCFVLLTVPAMVIFAVPSKLFWLRLLLPAFFFFVLISALFFMVRGFTLDLQNKVLWVHRTAWKTQISLAELEEVQTGDELLEGSIRYFGNGGLLSFTGWWGSQKLGKYRIFANDLRQCVYLKTTNQNWIVAPGEKEEFLADVRTLLK